MDGAFSLFFTVFYRSCKDLIFYTKCAIIVSEVGTDPQGARTFVRVRVP